MPVSKPRSVRLFVKLRLRAPKPPNETPHRRQIRKSTKQEPLPHVPSIRETRSTPCRGISTPVTIQARADSLARLALSATIFLAWTCSETFAHRQCVVIGVGRAGGLHPSSGCIRQASRSDREVSQVGVVSDRWHHPEPSAAKAQLYQKFSHASPWRRSSGCGTTSCNLDRSSVHTAAGCQAPRRSARIPSANRNCDP
jgi:hypothetical protein